MTNKKIKYNIFVYLMGFSTFIIILLWIFQTVFLEDMYKYIRKNELNSAIRYVEENINKINLDEMISDLESDKDIFVRRKEEYIKPNSNDKRYYEDDEDDHFGPRRMKKPEEIEENKTFILDDGSKLDLTFYAIITPVDATISTIRMQLLLVTATIVVLSLIIAAIVSKIVSKPIEELNESAKKLGRGEFDTKFNATGYLEISELSNTLDKASKELSKVDSLRRELMANISHDLRTPLALIYSYAEMMSDFPDSINQESLKVIMDETSRLTSLVNDVMDVSKLESGEMTLNKIEYCITEDIEEIIQRLNSMVHKDKYNIKFERDEKINIFADKIKINQVLYNLIINAINHTNDDKNILVKQSIQNQNLLIEIIDNGPGIDQKDIENIWDRYYKVDKVHKRSVVGTGLGLSIVKKIISLHYGKYGVKSELGKGSNFYFILPLK